MAAARICPPISGLSGTRRASRHLGEHVAVKSHGGYGDLGGYTVQ
jgi:hypothetical protein